MEQLDLLSARQKSGRVQVSVEALAVSPGERINTSLQDPQSSDQIRTTPEPEMVSPSLIEGSWSENTVVTLGLEPLRAAQITKAVGGTLLRDLVLSLPRSYIDRRLKATTKTFKPGEINTLKVRVRKITIPTTRTAPVRIEVFDSDGAGDIILFNRKAAFHFREGQDYIISGLCKPTRGGFEMPHPEVVLPADKENEVPWVEAQWPLTHGLSQFIMGGIMRRALPRIPVEPEWLDYRVVKKFGWPTFNESLTLLHSPQEPPAEAIRNRLAYDEALSRQVSFQIIRNSNRELPGRSLVGDGSLRRVALERFGHSPTEFQQPAINEILADMARPVKMQRLVQGDVGSGKTLVALMAMLNAVECGCQAVLMAPTDLLATQHFTDFERLSPVPVALLKGDLSVRERRTMLRGIAAGEFKIIVGTHAVFQASVEYKDLALIVIDEQHRFGVGHRAALAAKGNNADALHMTATPIPRTFFLSQQGWMDVSLIKGKPPGRKQVKTTMCPINRLNDLVDGIGRQIRLGGRVYWVCPLIEENEAIDLAAAEERLKTLTKRFGDAVAIVHGQQKADDRQNILKGFKEGLYKILVSTTVVEVGVNVPEATVMVIEHAERFGAAQLHQLRGRVGRGSEQSYCTLLHAASLGKAAHRRLKLLCDTDDGFAIAEEDFLIRGAGDAMGENQSGLPEYRILNPENDHELLKMAARDAAYLFQRDPTLSSDRGKAARRLLEVFGHKGASLFRTSG